MTVLPRIHDYREGKRYWGHDYSITPEKNPEKARVSGWGDGLRNGDLLLFTHPIEGGARIYRLIEFDYFPRPSDHWHGRVQFVPGSSDLGCAVEAAIAMANGRGPVVLPRAVGRSRILSFARQLVRGGR